MKKLPVPDLVLFSSEKFTFARELKKACIRPDRISGTYLSGKLLSGASLQETLQYVRNLEIVFPGS